MTSLQETIRDLRKHLKDKHLSVIIGAGFSKNASDYFLSWKELLHDMIIVMYGDIGKFDTSETKQFVDKVISERGYLAIASEYVRRLGFGCEKRIGRKCNDGLE